MIEHVVFFAVRPDTPESSVDAMVSALRKLPKAIPEVPTLSIGRPSGPSARGSDGARASSGPRRP